MNDLSYDPSELNLEVVRFESHYEAICRCINPVHIDHNPSSYFNMQTGLFFCHSCGFSANVKQICEITGGNVKKVPSNSFQSEFLDGENDWQKFLSYPLAIDHPYMKQRKVSNDLIKEYNILGSEDKIIIPITNSFGDNIGVNIRHLENHKFKYQVLGDKDIWPKVNWHKYDRDKPVFYVEGVFGVLNALRWGLQAFAILGAANFPKVYGMDEFDVIGVFDDDPAGWKASYNLLNAEPNAKCATPGYEADEISFSSWQEFMSGNYVTDDKEYFLSKFEHRSERKMLDKRLRRLMGIGKKKKYKYKKKA
jgi:hypothetical protein